MNTNQCPFAVYEYECARTNCRGCDILCAALDKITEARQVADNMVDYWISVAYGAER